MRYLRLSAIVALVIQTGCSSLTNVREGDCGTCSSELNVAIYFYEAPPDYITVHLGEEVYSIDLTYYQSEYTGLSYVRTDLLYGGAPSEIQMTILDSNSFGILFESTLSPVYNAGVNDCTGEIDAECLQAEEIVDIYSFQE